MQRQQLLQLLHGLDAVTALGIEPVDIGRHIFGPRQSGQPTLQRGIDRRSQRRHPLRRQRLDGRQPLPAHGYLDHQIRVQLAQGQRLSHHPRLRLCHHLGEQPRLWPQHLPQGRQQACKGLAPGGRNARIGGDPRQRQNSGPAAHCGHIGGIEIKLHV
ncbi:hypothetical protein D3C85_1089540 [compost metagenome]